MVGQVDGWVDVCGWVAHTCMHAHTYAKHANLNCEWLSPLVGGKDHKSSHRIKLSILGQDLFHFGDLT